MKQLTEYADKDFNGLCFLNLVDFDALYGHRRDPIGYGKAIEAFDQQLPAFLEKLNEDDLVMITADHGNDPIHHGTDHTREYVPLMVYTKKYLEGKKLPVFKTFADIGYTITDNFDTEKPKHGKSFLNLIGDR